ncbi:MAG: PIG-L family deacetylase [Acidimicrobiaceae bacterium]|nr:PIG-L family deacetylase [Acidimicrobiaceae bacterium]MBO0747712.1 PIG-L family deacetylase [Acidimicrobiaceae bacterium]
MSQPPTDAEPGGAGTRPAPSADLPVPSVALAIGAHPDDAEIGAGGTLAKWAAAGCSVHHLVLTDGSKGSWDPEEDTARLVALRREEAREASKQLGGGGAVTFLAWPDGELEAGLRQRWEVTACIRRVRPDVVLGHDPWKRYRLHPDHRNAGYLLIDGVVAARDPHFFPELADPPHRPSAILLWEADEVNHLEHLERSHLDAKVNALLAHRSQLHSTMGMEDPDDAPARQAFADRVHARARDSGAPGEAQPAEAFHLMTESLVI